MYIMYVVVYVFLVCMHVYCSLDVCGKMKTFYDLFLQTEVGKSELTRAPLGSSRNKTTPTTAICSSSSSEPPGHTTSSGSSGENGGGHTAQEDPQPLIVCAVSFKNCV